MKKTYSLYEAKTHLSEIIRQVREHGVGVTISYHGKPVAEIRPVGEIESEDPMEARIRDLTARGELSPRMSSGPLNFKVGKRVPGALQQFLAERNRDL